MTEAIIINKSAGASDGYGGGLSITRDARGVQGGSPGVNTANFTHTLTGYKQKTFEWATLSVLDNYADAGENVAGYFQGNAHGIGPTWALVAEVCDPDGGANNQVAFEADIWTVGADNGNRIGVDVVLGDAATHRGLPASRDPMGGSAGVRVHAEPRSTWTRGFQLIGNYVVGIDTSTSTNQTALRIGYGQTIGLEGSDTVKMGYRDGRIQFTWGGTPVFEIDMSTGETFKRGIKS